MGFYLLFSTSLLTVWLIAFLVFDRLTIWRVRMLGIFAEFETELRQERCLDGIAYAKQHGTRSGKPFGRPSLPPATLDKVRNALVSGQSVREAAKRAKVSKSAAGDVRTALVAEGLLPARALVA